MKSALCRHCLQILTAKRSKFENFAQLTLWFLTSMFQGGAERHLGAKPLAHVWRRHCSQNAPTDVSGSKKQNFLLWTRNVHRNFFDDFIIKIPGANNPNPVYDGANPSQTYAHAVRPGGIRYGASNECWDLDTLISRTNIGRPHMSVFNKNEFVLDHNSLKI